MPSLALLPLRYINLLIRFTTNKKIRFQHCSFACKAGIDSIMAVGTLMASNGVWSATESVNISLSVVNFYVTLSKQTFSVL